MLWLINIISTAKPTSHESMPNNMAQDYPKYYVDMCIISIVITKEIPQRTLQVSLDFGL